MRYDKFIHALRLAGATLLVLVSSFVHATGTEVIQGTGLQKNTAMSVSEFDAVNTYNGNLTVNVPLGPEFRTNGILRYRLSIHYQTNFWDFFEYSGASQTPIGVRQVEAFNDVYWAEAAGETMAGSEPRPEGVAGVGWYLGLGELVEGAGSQRFPGGAYRDESGALHAFGATMHVAGDAYEDANRVSYTHDGSYLRKRRSPAPGNVQEIDFPDGTIKRFSCVQKCGTWEAVWLLDWISDPLGYVLRITRSSATQPATGQWVWTLEEGYIGSMRHYQPADPVTAVRTHELVFDRVNGWQTRLTSVKLASPGNPAPSALYTLTYGEKQIYRPPVVPWAGPNLMIPYDGTDRRTRVWVLEKVTLPASAGEWKFNYTVGGEAGDTTLTTITARNGVNQKVSRLGGQLRSVQASTGGGYEYRYRTRSYHAFKCGGNIVQSMQSVHFLGVAERTRINAAGVRDEAATWRYDGRASAIASTTVCAPFGREFIGASLDPDGLLTLSFHDHIAQSSTYGAPFAQDLTDTINGTTRYRSSATYDVSASLATFQGDLGDAVRRMFPRYSADTATRTSGKLLRERYVLYDYSAQKCATDSVGDRCEQYNLRLASEHTRFYDDSRACQLEETSRYATNPSCANGPGLTAANKVWTETVNVDFDGLGHYRGAHMRSNFLDASDSNLPEEYRFDYTRYNDGVAYLPGATGSDRLSGAPAFSQPWILGKYTHTTSWENGRNTPSSEPSEILHARFRFNDATGQVTDVRRVKTTSTLNIPDPAGAAEPKNVVASLTNYDTFVKYGHALKGNRLEVIEEWFGGDTQSLNGMEWPTGLEPQYKIISLHQYGSLESSEYDCSGNKMRTHLATIDRGSGLPLITQGSNGAQTTYTYDSYGRVIRVAPPGERAHALQYASATGGGTANTITALRLLTGDTPDANAPASTFTYDDMGRLTKEVHQTSGGPATTEYQYLRDGMLEWMTVPLGPGETVARTKFEYDLLNRVTAKKLPDHATIGGESFPATNVTIQYDSLRQVYTTTDRVAGPHDAHLTEKFDAQGRLTEVSDDVTHAAYGYDAAGHLTAVVLNPNGQSTPKQERRFQYDGRGFLVREEHPELQETVNPSQAAAIAYAVDARGHATIVELIRSNGAPDNKFRLEMQYDRAERLINVYQGKAPAGERPPMIKEFTFNPTTCPTGSSCGAYEQNQLRLATRKNFIFDPAQSAKPMTVEVKQEYRYDPATGRVRSVRTTSEGEEGLGYLLNVTGLVTYSYNELGYLKDIIYPPMYNAPARTITQTYQRGQLKKLTDAGVDLATLAYRPNGAVSTVTFASNARDEIQSDALGRTVSILWYYTTQNGESRATKTGEIKYDGRGNISQIGRAGAADDAYTYDAAGRLSVATLPIGGQSFTYDAFGNLKSITTEGERREIPALGNNRLDKAQGYDYNSRGDLTKTPSLTMTFDALGAMTRVDGSSFGRFFVYSADDERVGTIEYRNGQSLRRERWSFRDGPRVIREIERTGGGSWTWARDYVHRGSLLACTFTPGTSGVVRRDARLDHLGSVALLTNAVGRRADVERRYFPFGTPDVETPLVERLAFTGHERDLGHDQSSAVDDLDYMHARYYSAELGRFASPDPGKDWEPRAPQSWNLYAYVRNNPATNVDPTGRAASRSSGSSGASGTTRTVGGKPTLIIGEGKTIVAIRDAAPKTFVLNDLSSKATQLGWAGDQGTSLIGKVVNGEISAVVDINSKQISTSRLLKDGREAYAFERYTKEALEAVGAFGAKASAVFEVIDILSVGGRFEAWADAMDEKYGTGYDWRSFGNFVQWYTSGEPGPEEADCPGCA